MNTETVTVGPDTSIEDLVEHYIYKYHYKMYPIVRGEQLLGCVSLGQVKTVPRHEWSYRRVGELACACGDDNTIGPAEDAMEALAKMNRMQVSRLMVVQGDRLMGIVSLKDMLALLSMKMELEEVAE